MDKKRTKISILGAGNVGATIAYTLTMRGISSEVVLIDINKEKAVGEAMDIVQGTTFTAPVDVYAGDYSAAAGSQIIVVTAGMGRKPGQTRLDLTRQNVNVVREMIPQVTKYAPDAVYVVVSNPVDIITYVTTKVSGLPQNQIIGSGTILDTARLRSIIGECIDIPAKNCHAYVLGEHGDSSVIPWSLATVSGIPVAKYAEISGINLDLGKIEQEMRVAGAEVIQRKGATFYAVSLSVARICECIIRDAGTFQTVSSMVDGQYGIEDVCFSLPNIIGINGITKSINPPLTAHEEELMRASAKCLKEAIAQCDFDFLK